MSASYIRARYVLLASGLLGLFGWTPCGVRAQVQPLPASQTSGFRLERHETSTAGSALFLADRPWYAPQQRFAAALTLGYAHRSLQLQQSTGLAAPIVEHALAGWVDVAASPLHWLLLRGSLPITLLERGTTDPQASIAPLEGAAIGDPRLGVVFALWRRPDVHPFSVHVGADAWLPAGSAYATHQGDSSVRVLPRAMLAGTLRHVWRWTVDAGFLYRPDATLGLGTRAISAGSEVQLGAALGLVTAADRLHLALEGRLAARVTQTQDANSSLLRGQLLASAQTQVGSLLQIGAALGSDFAAPGTPDLRVLLRVSISPQPARDLSVAAAAAGPSAAPQPSAQDPALSPVPAMPRASVPAAAGPAGPSDDADRDGIPDEADRCPYEPETRNGVRDDDGCPESALALQAARALRFPSAPATPPTASAAVSPTLPAAAPAPVASAAPSPASAGNGEPGVPASRATVPTTQSARDLRSPAAVDAAALPIQDADHDGVPDDEDRCPISPEDPDQFEDDDGCPDLDNDEDGIPDTRDRCPLEAETQNGFEDEDGCPDVAPASAPQAQVSAAGDRIDVNQLVQFKRRQVELDPASFPLLRAVVRILRAHPNLRVEVQGHTDAGGDPQRNQDLSQQRADSVRAFLVSEGIAPERLQARGYGASQPRYPNTSAEGRARNRRVEFVLQGDKK